ncbi:MAG TPA: TIGR01212 family radical SAM protein [Erysipelothrix sp.]|nr:TIGR01212 family radical SAM protein [Erysipelothrix sp.]
MKNNPFPYTLDNKRYHTYNYYVRKKYGSKVFKVCIDAGFTCPNRDGTVATGGCVFCSQRGSGDAILQSTNIEKQIEYGFELMENKWPDAKAIAYFQSYTNTHGTLEELKELYEPYFFDDRFIAIDIATRSDSLDKEKIEWFKKMSQYKEVNFEIGLQSIHHKTSLWMNRGHDTDNVTKIVNMLKEAGLYVGIHIINGFPFETKKDMLETAQYVSDLKPDMLKIHMLHVVKSSPLGLTYQKEPFTLLTMEEYVDVVVKQLEILDPDIVIARLTGDAMADELLAPIWTRRKTVVLNEIDKLMKQKNTYQGKYMKNSSR